MIVSCRGRKTGPSPKPDWARPRAWLAWPMIDNTVAVITRVFYGVQILLPADY